MPIYAKKVNTNDQKFKSRATILTSVNTIDVIPIPNSVILCNGCNMNVVETEEQEGYLVYLGKRELKADQPYDFYCHDCLRKYFPKAIIE